MLTQVLSLLQTKLIAGIEDAKAALRYILQCKWIAVGCEGQDVSKEGRLCLLQVQHSSVFQAPFGSVTCSCKCNGQGWVIFVGQLDTCCHVDLITHQLLSTSASIPVTTYMVPHTR